MVDDNVFSGIVVVFICRDYVTVRPPSSLSYDNYTGPFRDRREDVTIIPRVSSCYPRDSLRHYCVPTYIETVFHFPRKVGPRVFTLREVYKGGNLVPIITSTAGLYVLIGRLLSTEYKERVSPRVRWGTY